MYPSVSIILFQVRCEVIFMPSKGKIIFIQLRKAIVSDDAIFAKNDKFIIAGSKIVLKFKNISEEQLKILQLCFDAGFGERTSYGAGFMIERWKK